MLQAAWPDPSPGEYATKRYRSQLDQLGILPHHRGSLEDIGWATICWSREWARAKEGTERPAGEAGDGGAAGNCAPWGS